MPITPKNKYWQSLLSGKIEEYSQAGILTGRYVGKVMKSKFLKSDMQTASPGGRLYRLLAEKSREVLKPGGRICALTPRVRLLSRMLAGAGFNVEKVLEIRQGGLASYIVVGRKV